MLQKPDNSQGIFLWGAAAVPDSADESFASFPRPNTIKCSFSKFYFTVIITQIKFRNVTVLLTAALAVFQTFWWKAFIQFAKRRIFVSCLPAVWV